MSATEREREGERERERERQEFFRVLRSSYASYYKEKYTRKTHSYNSRNYKMGSEMKSFKK